MAYPLPICERLGVPYWKINLFLCFRSRMWRDWQAGREMSTIIPRIDRLVARFEARWGAAA